MIRRKASYHKHTNKIRTKNTPIKTESPIAPKSTREDDRQRTRAPPNFGRTLPVSLSGASSPRGRLEAVTDAGVGDPSTGEQSATSVGDPEATAPGAARNKKVPVVTQVDLEEEADLASIPLEGDKAVIEPAGLDVEVADPQASTTTRAAVEEACSAACAGRSATGDHERGTGLPTHARGLQLGNRQPNARGPETFDMGSCQVRVVHPDSSAGAGDGQADRTCVAAIGAVGTVDTAADIVGVGHLAHLQSLVAVEIQADSDLDPTCRAMRARQFGDRGREGALAVHPIGTIHAVHAGLAAVTAFALDDGDRRDDRAAALFADPELRDLSGQAGHPLLERPEAHGRGAGGSAVGQGD